MPELSNEQKQLLTKMLQDFFSVQGIPDKAEIISKMITTATIATEFPAPSAYEDFKIPEDATEIQRQITRQFLNDFRTALVSYTRLYKRLLLDEEPEERDYTLHWLRKWKTDLDSTKDWIESYLAESTKQ